MGHLKNTRNITALIIIKDFAGRKLEEIVEVIRKIDMFYREEREMSADFTDDVMTLKTSLYMAEIPKEIVDEGSESKRSYIRSKFSEMLATIGVVDIGIDLEIL